MLFLKLNLVGMQNYPDTLSPYFCLLALISAQFFKVYNYFSLDLVTCFFIFSQITFVHVLIIALDPLQFVRFLKILIVQFWRIPTPVVIILPLNFIIALPHSHWLHINGKRTRVFSIIRHFHDHKVWVWSWLLLFKINKESKTLKT